MDYAPSAGLPADDHGSMLDAVCANWDDDTARLAYADWLQENGKTRGHSELEELVRVGVALRAIKSGSSAAPGALGLQGLRVRQKELANKLYGWARWRTTPETAAVPTDRGFMRLPDAHGAGCMYYTFVPGAEYFRTDDPHLTAGVPIVLGRAQRTLPSGRWGSVRVDHDTQFPPDDRAAGMVRRWVFGRNAGDAAKGLCDLLDAGMTCHAEEVHFGEFAPGLLGCRLIQALADSPNAHKVRRISFHTTSAVNNALQTGVVLDLLDSNLSPSAKQSLLSSASLWSAVMMAVGEAIRNDPKKTETLRLAMKKAPASRRDVFWGQDGGRRLTETAARMVRSDKDLFSKLFPPKTAITHGDGV